MKMWLQKLRGRWMCWRYGWGGCLGRCGRPLWWHFQDVRYR